MLMKELASSYAGWEPPFIHHMVKLRLNSRHFRNLTTTPKLLANHNRSTWLRFLDYPPGCELSSSSSLPPHPICHYSLTETHQRKRATKTGKSTQVSEDGGFFFFFLTVLLLAWLSARNLLLAFFFFIRELVERAGGKYNLSHYF